jgi:hypothetical protein
LLLQTRGIDKGPYNQGFYFPSTLQNQACLKGSISAEGCQTPISEPIHASEDQYLVNTDFVLSSKHTLSEKFMYAGSANADV